MQLSRSLRSSCQKTHAGKLLFSLSRFRFAIFELEYPTPDGRTESKVLFILYAPDTCDSKEKFVYATSKDQVRKKL